MKKILFLLATCAILLFSNMDFDNKSFNSAGSVFSGSSNKIQNRKDNKSINPSDSFWTSGRFNF